MDEFQLFGFECDYDMVFGDYISITSFLVLIIVKICRNLSNNRVLIILVDAFDWPPPKQTWFWQLLNAELGGRPEKVDVLLQSASIKGIDASCKPMTFVTMFCYSQSR